MATKTLETKLILRYGTYREWRRSNVILEYGEPGVCIFDSNYTITSSDDEPANTPPAIGIKIGNGEDRFVDLPWVQAVAADVYSWAKQSSFTQIEGLDDYIAGIAQLIVDNSGGGGGGSSGSGDTLYYQLVQGEGQNANKYYLQSKTESDDDWTVDTLHYIDVNDFVNIFNWIGGNAIMDRYEGYPDLTTLVTQNIVDYFDTYLNYTDTSESHKFVTLVSEQSGVISVSRLQPSFEDISGTAVVSQGGTGRTTLAAGEVLLGNGANGINSIPIADEIANNNYLVPNYLIKAYVDAAVAGLSKAMHYIGDATSEITNNGNENPFIVGYNFNNALAGDVVTYDYKEFVWTGSYWRLLGDESSYAISGSIVDADVAVNANIAQSKIANLVNDLAAKVDIVEGKGLSSNDFTDALLQKLQGIATGAQVNTIQHIVLNNDLLTTETYDGNEKTIVLNVKEFDDNSRTKLNGIATGAEVNAIQSIIMDGQTITPDENRVVRLTSAAHTSHENIIEHIELNGTEIVPDNNKTVNIVFQSTAIEGAQVPNGNGSYENVDRVTNTKYLELARIAKTGNIDDIIQSNDEYITLYCGSSTEVI